MYLRRARIALAVMTVAAQLSGSWVNAAVSSDDVRRIGELLNGNRVEELYHFILERPGILEGTSELAILLRRFIELYESGQLLAFAPGRLEEMQLAVAALTVLADTGSTIY